MRRITKRRLIDAIVNALCYLVLYLVGAGPWALIIFPYALWHYHDGMTRPHLLAEDRGTKP